MAEFRSFLQAGHAPTLGAAFFSESFNLTPAQ